jgi:CheY-like chemotaxis protein
VIVEDDPDTQALLQDTLTHHGYTTTSAYRSEGVHELIRQVQPDLVILDLWLEHQHAGSMVLGMLAIDPATQHIPVIVCTAFRQLLPAQLDHLDAQGYVLLEKPFTRDDLLGHVQRCVPIARTT